MLPSTVPVEESLECTDLASTSVRSLQGYDKKLTALKRDIQEEIVILSLKSFEVTWKK